MALWERLHLPFLNSAKDAKEPKARIAAFRRTIEVDCACEKAHQWLAESALEPFAARRHRHRVV
jgi:hypothetical protein